MRSRFLAAVAVLLTASTAAADPAAWKTSFDPAAVTSQHATATESVLVVGAGEASAGRDEAVTALIGAYRTGGVKVVLDAQALGDVGALSDPEIVQRAKAQPVKRVAVVTTSQWVTWSAWLSQTFVNADVEVFDNTDDAKAWLEEAA